LTKRFSRDSATNNRLAVGGNPDSDANPNFLQDFFIYYEFRQISKNNTQFSTKA